MDLRPREVRYFVTTAGSAVVPEWLETFQDPDLKARIKIRLDRLKVGHFGDVKSVADAVLELRVDAGPGFRIYFMNDGATIVLLLCAGLKRSQERDIRRAKHYRREYIRRKGASDGKTHR